MSASKIVEYLNSKVGSPFLSFVEDPVNSRYLVLYSDKEIIKENSIFATRAKVVNVEKKIKEELAVDVSIAFNSEARSEIESSLGLFLDVHFAGVKCLVPSIYQDNTIVEICQTAGSVPEGLESGIRSFLQQFSLRLDRLMWPVVQSVVTTKDVLNVLRVSSPSSLADLAKATRVTSDVQHKALANLLDTMRKNGLLIWRSDALYALTEMGVAASPGSTTRESLDIKRVLALWRRKW